MQPVSVTDSTTLPAIQSEDEDLGVCCWRCSLVTGRPSATSQHWKHSAGQQSVRSAKRYPLGRIRQGATPWAHGNAKADAPALHLRSLLDSLVATIRVDHAFLTMQHLSRRGVVKHIGGGCFHRVDKAYLAIHPDLDLPLRGPTAISHFTTDWPSRSDASRDLSLSPFSQRILHRRIAQVIPLLHQVNPQHGSKRNGMSIAFIDGLGVVGLDQIDPMDQRPDVARRLRLMSITSWL